MAKDVTIGGIYEVLDDTCEWDGNKYFLIIDDSGTHHEILQKDCLVLDEDYKRKQK